MGRESVGRHPSASTCRSPRRARGMLAAVAVGSAGVLLAACGFNAQTNKPYTPAEGVNADVGTYQTQPAVKVRNLVIISDGITGVLSGSLISVQANEALTGITATALKQDGTDAGPLTVKLPGPIALGTTLVVLTDRSPITVSGGAISPGLNVRLTLSFQKAGQTTVIAPIVASTEAPWNTVSPAAAASSASPSS